MSTDQQLKSNSDSLVSVEREETKDKRKWYSYIWWASRRLSIISYNSLLHTGTPLISRRRRDSSLRGWMHACSHTHLCLISANKSAFPWSSFPHTYLASFFSTNLDQSNITVSRISMPRDVCMYVTHLNTPSRMHTSLE